MSSNNDTRAHHLCIRFKDPLDDAVAARVCAGGIAAGLLPLDTRCTMLRVFSCLSSQNQWLDIEKKIHFLHDIHEEVVLLLEHQTLPLLPGGCWVLVSWLPGVTDDEAAQAQRVLYPSEMQSCLDQQVVFSHRLFALSQKVSRQQLELWARGFLGNNLISHFSYGYDDFSVEYIPFVSLSKTAEDIVTPSLLPVTLDATEAQLEQLSKKNVWALTATELKAIHNHYADARVQRLRQEVGLPPQPTRCEIEVFAQTWSEHCKHKEFNALISFCNEDTKETKNIDSLFKTYIKASTAFIQDKLHKAQQDWLVKVFDDNAGLVKVAPQTLLAWKVETHNSPSALDPYGGAITGILGCHRDALGTGVGGARLFFNTNVLCFGVPGSAAANHLSPVRIMQGVVHGIADGGNKTGVPTVNGSVLFDHRFSGKPLVFCGSAALLPLPPEASCAEAIVHKHINPGDLVVVAGGRVGRDGIHGATFSSVELDEHAPLSAVQIGSPWTQKILGDFLHEALLQNLLSCTTDNGAGGLSSSVGELARMCGGATLDLHLVPLKYPGLSPWEILVSESQERMTLAVPPLRWEVLQALAHKHGVEITVIGTFQNSGLLTARYHHHLVASIDLDFLHEGVPRKQLRAQWSSAPVKPPVISDDPQRMQGFLEGVLGGWDVCSREPLIRRYDHEVQSRTVLKPLMGMAAESPQDAAVMRLFLSSDDYAGCAISNGICPHTADLDPYHSSAAALDEAVRQIIAVGGSLPCYDVSASGNEAPSWWTLNDNFCCPNSVEDPDTNPDGARKLGQLVLMCEALRDGAQIFGVPFTSGKDSMKNDFVVGGTKISIPPTVLYSAVAHIPDVRRVVSSTFKNPGDVVYVLGKTFEEWGGSALVRYLGLDPLCGRAPQVDFAAARTLYQGVSAAHKKGFLASCHDLSEGGLAVALAESCFGSGLGVSVDVLGVHKDLAVALFAESASRFVASVPARYVSAFESLLPSGYGLRVGVVTETPTLKVSQGNIPVFAAAVADLCARWRAPLRAYL